MISKAPMAIKMKALRRALGLSFFAVGNLKPNRANKPPPASNMDRKLVKNKSMAPPAALQVPSANPIPTTHKGGTNEMAMATPGNESDTFSRLRA